MKPYEKWDGDMLVEYIPEEPLVEPTLSDAYTRKLALHRKQQIEEEEYSTNMMGTSADVAAPFFFYGNAYDWIEVNEFDGFKVVIDTRNSRHTDKYIICRKQFADTYPMAVQDLKKREILRLQKEYKKVDWYSYYTQSPKTGREYFIIQFYLQ